MTGIAFSRLIAQQTIGNNCSKVSVQQWLMNGNLHTAYPLNSIMEMLLNTIGSLPLPDQSILSVLQRIWQDTQPMEH